ncbi:6217_t:CDS:2, partial [Gigaspora margarita]
QIQENEYDKTLEQNMPKRQKKLKFSDMKNNKENAFYNNKKVEFELSALKDITNIWNNSSTEYSGEDNETSQKLPTNIIEPEPMTDTSTQVEQTIKCETTQDPIKKKTQDTNPLQSVNTS